MNQEKIGKLILNQRKKKNLTQENLADKLGISKNAVSKWERGLNLPDVSIMQDLCKILDITLNELFVGEKVEDKNFKEIADRNLLNVLEINSYKLQDIMKKELKNFGKILDILLIILTSLSLIINALTYTNTIYNSTHDTMNLNNLIISTPFKIFFLVDNILIFIVSIFYIIDVIKQKKNMTLRLSFCIFSILTTNIVSNVIINLITSWFCPQLTLL